MNIFCYNNSTICPILNDKYLTLLDWTKHNNTNNILFDWREEPSE